MKPCTQGKRHKWAFVRNEITESGTLRVRHVSRKGLYRCACGAVKYGEPYINPEGYIE